MRYNKYHRWDLPEIEDWDDDDYPRDGERPVIVIGGGFGGGFGCRPRFGGGFGFDCPPRFYGCRPRYFFDCRPRFFTCLPRPCFPI